MFAAFRASFRLTHSTIGLYTTIKKGVLTNKCNVVYKPYAWGDIKDKYLNFHMDSP